MFDNSMTGLRLHPVLFESKALTGPACSDHSHPGEAKAGDFATTKFRYFLWGKAFTWITDCSSLKAFFDQRDMPNHQLERVRMRMLCYQFTIVHRTSNMVKEVDLLTRYNRFATQFRSADEAPNIQENPILISMGNKHAPPIGTSNIPLSFVGPTSAPKTEAASRWSTDFSVILGSAGIGEVEEAVRMLGQLPIVVSAVEENEDLNRLAEERLGQTVHPSTAEMVESLSQTGLGNAQVDLYTATCRASTPEQTLTWISEHLETIAVIGELAPIQAVLLLFNHDDKLPPS